MTLCPINDNKIKVTLSFEERFRLFGEIDYLSLENPSVKTALKIILKKIKYESRFLHDCSKVYIDLYKGNSGGFIIYLTKLRREEAAETTFQFEKVDNLLDALLFIKRLTSDYRIFAHQDKFYLQIGKVKALDLSPQMSEFCGIKAI